jgi:hypothetical protein
MAPFFCLEAAPHFYKVNKAVSEGFSPAPGNKQQVMIR